MPEHPLGEERGREVARHELAGVVDEEAAVGVAVVGHPERGALLARAAHDELAVLRQQRVRLVVRERPVGLEVAADDLDLGQPGEHARQHLAGHAVRAVHDDPERRDRRDVDEAEHALDEGVPHVDRLDRAALRVPPLAAHRTIADLDEPRLAPDRQRAAPHDLHPRVGGRVVRRRHHDPAVEPELARREVHDLGSDHAEIGHVRSAVGDSGRGSLGHRRRRQAHVAADRDPPRLELLRERAPDRIRARLVELRGVERTHVVCLESSRIEHRLDPTGCPGLAREAQREKTFCAFSAQAEIPPGSRKLQPPSWISAGIVS